MADLTYEQIVLLSAFRREAVQWVSNGNPIAELNGRNLLWLLDIIEQLAPGATVQPFEEWESNLRQKLGLGPKTEATK